MPSTDTSTDTGTDLASWPGPARFNHIALSLPADALDEAGRAAIVDFYGDVFGWHEIPQMTEDRTRLVLSVHQLDQFVYLIAESEPMTAPRLDHFGVAVESLDHLHELLGRVKAKMATTEGIDLIDYAVDDHGVVKIHAFYVGHLLPMMVEVQYFETSF